MSNHSIAETAVLVTLGGDGGSIKDEEVAPLHQEEPKTILKILT